MSNLKDTSKQVFDDPSVCHRAIFVLDPDSPLRKWSYYIIHHHISDRFILFCILLNCIILALYDPENEESARNQILNAFDIPFVIVYTLEMILKVMALGFVLHPGAYLRDSWNILDFIVVISGLISLGDVGPNISAIKTLRVLRPLRTVKRFPEMRRLVTTLLNSIPQLLNVGVLISFIFIVFAIVGVQMLAGGLRGNCFYDGVRAVDREGQPVICGVYTCPDYVSDNGTSTGGVCVKGPENPNPNQGVTNFDNFANALLSNFQAITLEGWAEMMYMFQDGLSSWAWLYFLLLIFLGSFFVINLMLAVINTTFIQARHDAYMTKLRRLFHEKKEKLERQRLAMLQEQPNEEEGTGGNDDEDAELDIDVDIDENLGNENGNENGRYDADLHSNREAKLKKEGNEKAITATITVQHHQNHHQNGASDLFSDSDSKKSDRHLFDDESALVSAGTQSVSDNGSDLEDRPLDLGNRGQNDSFDSEVVEIFEVDLDAIQWYSSSPRKCSTVP